jgi:two-component system chemotaxis response regulator CheB
MANWLNGISPLEIKQAESGERPKPGYVYMAPTGQHLRMSFNGSFILSPDRDQSRHVPSGDVLLESAARAYGPNAIGVVLTGMGVDGAQGLLEMRKRGAHTIVQDEASSVVFGMPKAAIDLGGQEYVVPLENIADLLVRLAAGEALP